MLAMLPQEEQPGLLFKSIFLDCLPTNVRVHVQGSARQQECRELAVAADVVWQAKIPQKKDNVAAIFPNQVEEVTEAVAAVQLNSAKHERSRGTHGGQRRGEAGQGHGAGWPGGQQSGQKSVNLCYRHAKFGNSAWAS